jgi:metallo-beta-lactamase family protein
VDSPLAVNVTEIFRLHPECYDRETRKFMAANDNRSPFGFHLLRYVRSVEDSKDLNFVPDPVMIIAASGMCEGGRILHHLKNHISDPNAIILFVGYQAENTLGRRILDGVSPVRIFGDMYKVRAQVERIDGYSAHADRAELLDWAHHFDRSQLKRVFLVHGEEEGYTGLKSGLEQMGFRNVTVPDRGDSFEL